MSFILEWILEWCQLWYSKPRFYL